MIFLPIEYAMSQNILRRGLSIDQNMDACSGGSQKHNSCNGVRLRRASLANVHKPSILEPQLRKYKPFQTRVSCSEH